ncbi:hypothetical protein [Alienimonas chondri]|uniref:Uncharacterized protein n=1 Tax=Alienimonas chondri TaxID=2681879 RepID=A0ABX1VHX0_9PLAN|nr:hypothetical protein [Alienimonas chondri]NNJ27670.1 hypothetical protein [Alienimonas chondri]
MSHDAGMLTFMSLLALSYAAFLVVGFLGRGPGRWWIAASGPCGIAGTAIPIVSSYNNITDGPDILNDVPELVGGAMILGSFSAFVAAQVLLLIGLLRAWRAKEAMFDFEAQRAGGLVPPDHA